MPLPGDQFEFVFPADWFKLPRLILLVVVGIVGLFGGGWLLSVVSNGSSFRGCISDLRGQTKLPADWKVDMCKPGEWSGEFAATVSVPGNRSKVEALKEFERLNKKPTSQVVSDHQSLTIFDGESRLSIEPGKARQGIYSIRLDLPK